MQYILAMDQGTSSSRALLFDKNLNTIALAQQEFKQYYPHSGWVEHDAEEIWTTSIATAKQVLSKISPAELAGIGITNQRETTLIWDRASGKPIYNAIVWQDRRTADFCAQLKAAGHEQMLREKTGLLLDPYFSASKISWLLNNVPGARGRAERGELAFGTIDSFLLWRLTNGQTHATDATNAARTLLFNIHQQHWDEELLELFAIPRQLLPEVRDCAADYGMSTNSVLGVTTQICGIAGDQQAAAIGQACVRPGMIKATYGTGCFALLNTGDTAVMSSHRLLTTIASRINGHCQYALEGSIFIAGAAVQWLRDGLKIINNAAEIETLAQQADIRQEVYLVPAFTGLGAPYWDSDARGTMFGITRNTGAAELCRATLAAVAYQTRDLLDAMNADWQQPGEQLILRVDGGMSANNWLMQFMSDITHTVIDRPMNVETTALGAAYLAGLQLGLLPGFAEFGELWQRQSRFSPLMDNHERERLYGGWQNAVGRTLSTRP